MKTFERLDYCPHIQPIRLIFLKSAATFHNCVLSLKFAHPWTCITPCVDLHQIIWSCIRPSGLASFYSTLSGQLKKEAGKKIDTIGIISKLNLIIDEIFISEWTLSLSWSELGTAQPQLFFSNFCEIFFGLPPY